ncbi:hypothetical protein [Kitasatospora sp. NPDC050463]|uniref:hypothetical protein n=1 Tax=Kitasatospora sp. NPDC050463 TaxID=3155786 RepID=UPI0033E4C7DD
MDADRTLLAPRRNVGDFDCSGEDIERDFLARTSGRAYVERVLLTNAQRLRYRLPPAEGKKGDPRWPAFAARYGFDPDRPVQWEVEALEPDDLLTAAVEPYVCRQVLAAVLDQEERQRTALARFVRRWPGDDR